MILEALSLPFFQRVLIAGLLAAIACGILGSLVVVKRMASMTGGISHAAFGGVGLGFWLGFDPMLGALGFGILAAAAISFAYRRWQSGLDTLVSMLWSVGMALGILFVAFAPGYTPDLTGYLFGNLLLVPWDYVVLVAILDAVILAAVILLFQGLQAVSFDEEFADIMGLRVGVLFFLQLGLSALAVVVLIRVVGVVLAIALLTIPAATARLWTSRLGVMMGIATGLSGIATLFGLFLSYALAEHVHVSIPPGPLIVILSAAVYATSGLLRKRTA